jgi:PPK2 family polyphosphate:nucleotide phosphotransferase
LRDAGPAGSIARGAKDAGMKHKKLAQHFRIEKPERFRLRDFDPAETAGFTKEAASRIMAKHAPRLTDLQERLYAENSWAVLIILQGIDAAGKDGAIKHVMAGLNPQGCVVHPFGVPTADELDHDYLWRAVARLPPRGDIGIFNRSYYEEVLVVRVHDDLLVKQRLPAGLVTKRIWKHRFADFNAFERHLVRNGTVVIKFHLRISKAEQKRRLLARLDEPAKRWKFSLADLAERKLWGRYTDAYEDMIRNTSTTEAPWYIVPADNKWFARLVISTVIIDVLDRLDLEYPKFDRPALRDMKRMRKALEAE